MPNLPSASTKPLPLSERVVAASSSRSRVVSQPKARRRSLPLPPSPLGRTSYVPDDDQGCAQVRDACHSTPDSPRIIAASQLPGGEIDSLELKRATSNVHARVDHWSTPALQSSRHKSIEQMIQELKEFQKWAKGVLEDLELER